MTEPFDPTPHPSQAIRGKVAGMSGQAQEALLYLHPVHGLPSFTPKRIRAELAAAGLPITGGGAGVERRVLGLARAAAQHALRGG